MLPSPQETPDFMFFTSGERYASYLKRPRLYVLHVGRKICFLPQETPTSRFFTSWRDLFPGPQETPDFTSGESQI